MKNKEVPPLVSVIIPTYKRAEYLMDTIESVRNQTYPNIEIIVVDDNGLESDYQKSTYSILKSFIDRGIIHYLAHEVNKNGSTARNTGFYASHGRYINFLDDDDLLLPAKIANQVARLEGSPSGYGATYCNSRMLYKRNSRKGIQERLSNVAEEGNMCVGYLLEKYFFNTSTILFKREVIEELKGFDETYYRHQDFELMVRFFRKYKVLCTNLDTLVIFDQTKDRGNSPNPQRDLLIKRKFITEFSNDFANMGAKKEIIHHLWLNCTCNALSSCDFVVFREAFALAFKAKMFTISEVIKMLTSFMAGIIYHRK